MAIRRKRLPRLKSKTKLEPQVELQEVVEEKEIQEDTKKPAKEFLEEIEEYTNQLSVINTELKVLESRKKEISSKLKKFTKEYGVQNDKGSFNYALGNLVLTNAARVISKLNQEKAVDIFSRLGVLKDVSEIKTVVNEDLVEQAILNEKVPKEILDEIMDTHVNYAFTLKQMEEEVDA